MQGLRSVERVSESVPTIEGAGVRLRRAFGSHDPSLDPFLLLDDFHSTDPEDYVRGFPWHPHRGIETITYLLHGEVTHGDSLGNKGVIKEGEVQWMTAGSGIIHEEMPQRSAPVLWGFQLWANLPRRHKMMPPRYRDVQQDRIPEVRLSGGVRARVICGELDGAKGPVQDVVTEPEYLDVALPPEAEFVHSTRRGHNVLAYVIEGEGRFDASRSRPLGSRRLVVFGKGEAIRVSAGGNGVRFLLLGGKPIGEPVAWYGPIVMNTAAELELAFREYRDGTFIKHGRS